MPPSSRPNAPPPAAIALQTPSAFVRSSPSANVVVMIDSAAGETSAPPSPCSARAATSHVSVVARPFRSDAKLKIATPARNSRRRPNRSPARPPSSRKPPNDERVAVDHPLQVRGAEAEVGLDRRQRDVHDGRVEHDHELREAHDHEHEPAVALAGRGQLGDSHAPTSWGAGSGGRPTYQRARRPGGPPGR